MGSSRWLRPPTPQFRVGDTNMLVSKNAKICVTPTANAKICVSPNANPQKRSGGILVVLGPQREGLALGFCVVYFLFPRIGYPTRTQFPVEYRLMTLPGVVHVAEK